MTNDTLSCAYKELKRSPRRTIAVTVGYFITVCFLIIVSAVLLYSRVAQDIVIGSAGTHFVTWLPACGDISSLTEEELSKLAKGIVPDRCKSNCDNCTGCDKKPIDLLNEGFIINTNTTRLLSVELCEKVAALTSVKDASAYLMFRFRDSETGRLLSVGGVDPDSLAVAMTCCAKSDIIEGNFLGKSSLGKALVENGYAINHNLKIGSKIIIAEVEFEIIGIISTGAKPVKPDIFMLFAEAERVINKRIHNPLEKETNVILVESINAEHHVQAMTDVSGLMKNDSIMTSGCYRPAFKALGLSKKMVWAFMIIVAVGAVFFTLKIQWAAVIERSRGIAILKAIGWRNSSIIWQLLAESLIQSVLGSLAGALAGTLILYILPLNDILNLEATMVSPVNLTISLLILVFAVASGLIGGLVPVISIVRQRPSDILRRI